MLKNRELTIKLQKLTNKLKQSEVNQRFPELRSELEELQKEYQYIRFVISHSLTSLLPIPTLFVAYGVVANSICTKCTTLGFPQPSILPRTKAAAHMLLCDLLQLVMHHLEGWIWREAKVVEACMRGWEMVS